MLHQCCMDREALTRKVPTAFRISFINYVCARRRELNPRPSDSTCFQALSTGPFNPHRRSNRFAALVLQALRRDVTKTIANALLLQEEALFPQLNSSWPQRSFDWPAKSTKRLRSKVILRR